MPCCVHEGRWYADCELISICDREHGSETQELPLPFVVATHGSRQRVDLDHVDLRQSRKKKCIRMKMTQHPLRWCRIASETI